MTTRMAALVGRALQRHAAVTPVAVWVTQLGIENELAAEHDTTAPEGAVPVFLYGHHAIVGPMPPAGACPRCLARRWQSIRAADLRDALEWGGETHAVGASPYVTPVAADVVAALISARMARPDATGTDVFHVDLESLRVRRETLVADSECPRCGRVADPRSPAPLQLEPAAKPAPGVFRVRELDDFRLDVEAFANPVCGALSRGLQTDLISTSTAPALGSVNLRSGPYSQETLYGGHTDSYARSETVAVLEGLERAAGLRRAGSTTAVRASLRELASDSVETLDPRDCGLYSDEFYRTSHLARFSPDEPIKWVWGTALRDGRSLLVPEVLAYYHTRPEEARFVQETSNGCASGGCLAEAVYFGLMEAIERDAFLIAWYGRARLPEIDPSSSTRAATRQMVDRLAMYGYRARFFDTRVTFSIPTVTAVAVRQDGALGSLAFGGGASLEPEEAMSAALCEIATDAVKLPARTRADESRLRPMVDDFDQVQTLHDHPMLYGLPEMRHHAAFLLESGTTPASIRDRFHVRRPGPPISTDLLADLETCVAEVTAAGFEIVVVDQTMPEERDLGLHTVKVIVPGLVPIDFGWRRQRAPLMARVRTALRASGHRDRDLTPADLNPAPHPFP